MHVEGVNGIGITEQDGDYAVLVNLETVPKDPIPESVAGVAVVCRVVGRIHKQE